MSIAVNDIDAAIRVLSGGANRVMYQSAVEGNFDIPSLVVKVPLVTLGEIFGTEDTTPHPAFVINGTVYNNIYVAKYPCLVKSGFGLSLPLQPPENNISLADAYDACAEMGVDTNGLGWHLMTALEYNLLSWLSWKGGTQPGGNLSYGTGAQAQWADVPAGESPARTLAGSGPANWNHTGFMSGVSDLVGNVREHINGLYLTNDGTIVFVTPSGNFDNSAALVHEPYPVGYYKYFDSNLDLTGTVSGAVKISGDSADTITLTTGTRGEQAESAVCNPAAITADFTPSSFTRLGLLGLHGLGKTGLSGCVKIDDVTSEAPAALPVITMTHGGYFGSGTEVGGIFCTEIGFTPDGEYTVSDALGFRCAYIDPEDTVD